MSAPRTIQHIYTFILVVYASNTTKVNEIQIQHFLLSFVLYATALHVFLCASLTRTATEKKTYLNILRIQAVMFSAHIQEKLVEHHAHFVYLIDKATKLYKLCIYMYYVVYVYMKYGRNFTNIHTHIGVYKDFLMKRKKFILNLMYIYATAAVPVQVRLFEYLLTTIANIQLRVYACIVCIVYTARFQTISMHVLKAKCIQLI